MKLSIIVVAWNVGPYIEQCLRSCLFENFPSYEVIVVVNKSTDGTGEIVDVIASEFPAIFKVLRQSENIGLGPARNLGLNEARGEYVMFLDGDDWYANDAAGYFNRILAGPEFTVCLFNHDKVFVDGRVEANGGFRRLCKLNMDRSHDRSSMFQVLGTAWNKVIETAFLQSHQYVFASGFYEDVDWNIKVLTTCKTLMLEPQVLIHYRKRPGSILSSVDDRHFDVFDRYEAVLTFLDANPVLLRDFGVAAYAYCSRNLWRIYKGQRTPPARKREFARISKSLLKAFKQRLLFKDAKMQRLYLCLRDGLQWNIVALLI